MQSKLYDIEMGPCGILRGFELKAGLTTSHNFAAGINYLMSGRTNLETVAQALFAVQAITLREFKYLEKRTQQISNADGRTRL